LAVGARNPRAGGLDHQMVASLKGNKFPLTGGGGNRLPRSSGRAEQEIHHAGVLSHRGNRRAALVSKNYRR